MNIAEIDAAFRKKLVDMGLDEERFVVELTNRTGEALLHMLITKTRYQTSILKSDDGAEVLVESTTLFDEEDYDLDAWLIIIVDAVRLLLDGILNRKYTIEQMAAYILEMDYDETAGRTKNFTLVFESDGIMNPEARTREVSMQFGNPAEMGFRFPECCFTLLTLLRAASEDLGMPIYQLIIWLRSVVALWEIAPKLWEGEETCDGSL